MLLVLDYAAGVPWRGARGSWAALVFKKMLQGGPRGRGNYSSHSKLLVLINIQHFHPRIGQTKIRNRDYREHCSGNILLLSDAIISHQSRAQSSRLRGAKRLSGGPKFEIKHKSRCLQNSKLVDWGTKHVGWGSAPPLAPALYHTVSGMFVGVI